MFFGIIHYIDIQLRTFMEGDNGILLDIIYLKPKKEGFNEINTILYQIDDKIFFCTVHSNSQSAIALRSVELEIYARSSTTGFGTFRP